MSDEPVPLRHPELVSGSFRGEGQEQARGEMLKQVQHDPLFGLLYRRTKEHVFYFRVTDPYTLLLRITYSQ